LDCAINNRNKCFRQYDVGDTAPNLDIFTPGQYLGPNEHGMFLFDVKKEKYTDMLKKKSYMNPMNLKTVPHRLEAMPFKPGRIRGTPAQQFTNKNAQVKKVDDESQLSIADLCDEEHGRLQSIFTDEQAAEIPIVVIACRSGIDKTAALAAANAWASVVPAGQFAAVDSESSSSSVRDSSSGISRDSPGPNDYDEEISDHSISEGGKNRKKSNKKRRKRPNATKKRRKRRNATKKRRKRPNVTKKRRS
jgi:hypothetical protein